MRNAAFPRILLILAMLFTQLGALTHGISHTREQKSQSAAPSQIPDQSLPHDKHCDLCEAYAQIGSTIVSSDINFSSSENCETRHLASFSSYTSDTFVAFAARAPPYSA